MVIVEWLLSLYAIGIFSMVLLNLLMFPRATKSSPYSTPMISVLIPARDEAFNLEKNLPIWIQVNYPNREIIVLDDQSQDSTWDVAQRYSTEIKLLKGSPLPKDWLGKNWACHQLSQKAQGEILLFVDADVTPSRNSLTQIVATMEKDRLDACSAFLKQTFSHWTAKAILPWALQFPIFSWPPLFLNRFFRFSSLSIGNGQWFCFRKEVYLELGGHTSVKKSVIEDIALAKILTERGFDYKALLAPEIAQVNMYHSKAELRAGLTKNLASIYGGHIFKNILFLILFAGLIASVIFSPKGLGATTLFAAYVCVQWGFQQRRINPVLAAIGLPLTVWLFLSSIVLVRLKKTQWKGRPLG